MENHLFKKYGYRLVTDAKQRKSVPIIRSLGRRGIPVSQEMIPDLAWFFLQILYRVPSIWPDSRNFVDWLLTKAEQVLLFFMPSMSAP
jgi:hypothetical protein